MTKHIEGRPSLMCPHCKHVYSLAATYDITGYGEGQVSDLECESCGKVFMWTDKTISVDTTWIPTEQELEKAREP